MTAFEDWLQAEIPKRSALETYATTSYDGDPNDGGAPAALQNAPLGTWFFRDGTSQYYRKYSGAADSWELTDISLWATTEELDIYVRDDGGSDSNPGTISEPLESIIEAINRIPFNVNHPIRIHIGPHTGSGYEQPVIKNKVLNANVYLMGDGGGGSTDGFTEIISSTAALAGSTNLLVKTSGLSDTEYGGFGELWGCTIEILTGAAAGNRRTVHHNTATDIVPNFAFTAVIAEGDTYRIVKPETVIYEPNNYSKPFVENAGYQTSEDFRRELPKGIWLINLRLNTAGSSYRFISNYSRVQFFGFYTSKACNFEGNSLYFAGKETIPTVSPPLISAVVEDLGLPHQNSWTGWGFICDSSSALSAVGFGSGASFVGVMNSSGIQGIGGNGKILLQQGSLWGADGTYVIRNYFGYNMEIGGYPLVPLYIGSPNSSNNGIESSGTGSYVLLRCNTGTPLVLMRGAGNGLVSSGKGEIEIDINASSRLELDVGGIGLITRYGGTIKLSNTVPTITATGGDFSEDNGDTTRSISELGASGDVFSNQIHGIIYRE